MRIIRNSIFALFALALLAHVGTARRQQQQPQPEEWADNFDGAALDEGNWERFSFEGAGGGKLEVKGGRLLMRGPAGSRAGVRSRKEFAGDRFIFEATLTKVTRQVIEPGKKDSDLGFGILCVLFDGSGRNRIEWLLTSENTFEAWAVVDGRGERLDNRKLGTKDKRPTLGIVRRGDEFLFMLNGEAGLTRTIKNMPQKFHAMIYGFGTTETEWDSARVVTVK